MFLVKIQFPRLSSDLLESLELGPWNQHWISFCCVSDAYYIYRTTGLATHSKYTSLWFLINIYFRIILDLQKSFKYKTESTHIPFTHFPLLLISYCFGTLTKLRNCIGIPLFNYLRTQDLFIVRSCTQKFFEVFRHLLSCSSPGNIFLSSLLSNLQFWINFIFPTRRKV